MRAAVQNWLSTIFELKKHELWISCAVSPHCCHDARAAVDTFWPLKQQITTSDSDVKFQSTEAWETAESLLILGTAVPTIQ